MQPLVYVETSIISYLAARLSRELVTAAHQQLTADWWSSARPAFRVGISELVVQEASLGDPESARRRLELMSNLSVLQLTQDGRELARALMGELAIPSTAAADALHIAIAAENGAHFLLTWNCRHIANARTRALIERVLQARGYTPPILCTPEELMNA
jgi:predicted nucleic acid-binding protein